MTVDIESHRRHRTEKEPPNPVHALRVTLGAVLVVIIRLVFEMAKMADQPIAFFEHGVQILMLVIAALSAYQLYGIARRATAAVNSYPESQAAKG